jgi:heme/copper-type cytochrome/quinol oxidase subunit 2
MWVVGWLYFSSISALNPIVGAASMALVQNRFPDMKTEWLALWLHFLWSGGFTMVCCIVAWWKVGLAVQAAKRNTSQTRNEPMTMRRRLLNIAGMISVCLILNVIATVLTSAKLNEWSRTTDISLACEIKETWNSRSWDVYGFDDDTIVEVCSAEDAIPVTSLSCVDSCTWYPEISVEALTCSTKWKTLEEMLADDSPKFTPCDCPCSSMIEIQKPR